ncbi:BamA/TamA family outer membrane protein [Terriglobus sp. RCC_193]|uniref:BamA/TamA family outer membrane protein n=1 Tax=Terriglobus sp. RCC_193 TaxID=3239218 RepID=UPI0035263F7D
MTGIRCGLILAVVLLSRLLSAQKATPANSPRSESDSAPILFGTNVDVDQGGKSKGTNLGLGAYESKKKDQKKKKHRGEFAIAPIPMVNPSIGNGGGLGIIYAVRLDGGPESEPSALGAAGFITAKGSWSAGLGGQIHLRDEKYRITVAVGGGKFNYNYFGVGTGSGGKSIPLSQTSKAFLIEPKIRVYRDWYLGPRYHIIGSTAGLNSTTLDPSKLLIPLPSTVDLRTAALGIRLQRDTSDSSFYPTSGSLFDALADFYAPQFGGKRTYQNLTLTYNKYLPLGKKNILAIHASSCMVTDGAPFYDVCELGLSKDLRGYQVGQFRDDRMLVGQMEFRRELFWRIGATAFAGAGAVAHDWGGFSNSQAEPGGGLGLRFILAKRNHINLRMDYAWGDSSHAAYVSLGEAF